MCYSPQRLKRLAALSLFVEDQGWFLVFEEVLNYFFFNSSDAELMQNRNPVG